MKNTKQSGVMQFVVFCENDRFFGVCLDFNIIVDGLSAKEVQDRVINISYDHLNTVRKNDLDDSLLNRHAPKEYWEMYEKFQKMNASSSPKIQETRKQPVLSSYVQLYQNHLGKLVA